MHLYANVPITRDYGDCPSEVTVNWNYSVCVSCYLGICAFWESFTVDCLTSSVHYWSSIVNYQVSTVNDWRRIVNNQRSIIDSECLIISNGRSIEHCYRRSIVNNVGSMVDNLKSRIENWRSIFASGRSTLGNQSSVNDNGRSIFGMFGKRSTIWAIWGFRDSVERNIKE